MKATAGPAGSAVRPAGPAARRAAPATPLLAAAYFFVCFAGADTAGAQVAATGVQAAALNAQAAAPSSQASAPGVQASTPSAQAAAPGAQAPVPGTAANSPAGVDDQQRAWQHWTLNCQGCHRPDGTGSAGTAPSLAGTVARFLSVPGGREYLGRVPGVATSPLSDADLSEVMNWMLWRFDREHIPADFQPFTAAEIGRLRGAPLRLEASQMRAELLKKADETGTP